MKNNIINRATLLKLYSDMVRIRTIEEGLANNILSGEIKCPTHLYSGQEAVAVGFCNALKKTDYVYGNHRSHGYYIAKGGNINALIAEIYGKETGCSKGRGGSMHIIDNKVNVMGTSAMIAGTIPQAVGTALAMKLKNKNDIVVSFFGDAAGEEGALYESLNFAKIYNLPIVFVVENNLYSQHLHILERKPHDKIGEIGRYFRIPYKVLNGNNVVEVYKNAQSAVAQARNFTPMIIECLTYRQRGHVGAKDDVDGVDTKDIRDKKEIVKWKKRDPIIFFHKKYAKKTGLNTTIIKQIESKVHKEFQSAVNFARKSPFPKPSSINNYVFEK